MNLLSDSWLPVLLWDGEKTSQVTICPSQIAELINGQKVIDVAAPRADFKGALYQLLIGLLQSTFAPKAQNDWHTLWASPPDSKMLEGAFSDVVQAFEIDSDGSAFMQDYDLPESGQKNISALLIEAPGGKTEKDNLDHFVKRGQIWHMDVYWAAVALFTLQINAPAGGVGHRVSLRGGGPLTTLILPPETKGVNTLWHKLWLNILTQDETKGLTGNNSLSEVGDVFPWMKPTPTSEKKNSELTPEQAHPYHMYWSMPRRVRLDFDDAHEAVCDVSGNESENTISSFRTKNYGINYSDTWQHPLTPYSVDPGTGLLPIKAQPGGLFYRHWLGLVVDDDQNHKQAAKIVRIYHEYRRQMIQGDYQPRLWAFGYDMDNMKARCWYESTFPILDIPKPHRRLVQKEISHMVSAAMEVVKNTRQAIKQAWFNRPKDVKGDLSSIDLSFWHNTEAVFYASLEELLAIADSEDEPIEIRKRWKQVLRREAEALFDQWALSGGNEDGDMKRVLKARNELQKWLAVGKQMKLLAA